jgi:hypothetical protein
MRKTVFELLFLFFTMISCTNQKVIGNATPTNAIELSLFSNTPVATFTPVVTATPITSNEQNFDVVLTPYLNLSNSCKNTDKLSDTDLKVTFLETVPSVDSSREFVSEVAESISKKYRAYLVQNYARDIISSTAIPVYCEGCGRVYLENIQSGKKYQVTWSAFPSGISMIYNLVWVDDNILVVREAQSEEFYLVFGFDVNKQKLVYFSEISCSNQ